METEIGIQELDSLELARQAADFISDLKGENILVIDIHELTQIADYFVICNGTSDRQIRAIADKVQNGLRENSRTKPYRVDGEAQSGWILMDYGSVVVHIFSPEMRSYYNLEAFWREGKTVLRMQ